MKNIGQIHKAALKDHSLISNVLIERIKVAAPKRPARRKSKGKGKVEPEAPVINGRAIATDGYILAIRNVELDETDVPGLIPAESLSHGKQTGAINVALTLATATVQSPRWGFSKVYARPEDHPDKFPEIAKVLKQADDAIAKNGSIRLGINAAFLFRLYESLATEGVPSTYLDNYVLELEVPMPRKNGEPVLDPIKVKGSQGEGLIMPVRI